MSDVVVLWEPPSICWVNPTSWHGKLVSPVKTIVFAKVSHRIDGQCYLSLEPRGWDGEPRWLVEYPNPNVAKRHVEAWARRNWKRILREDERVADVPRPPRSFAEISADVERRWQRLAPWQRAVLVEQVDPKKGR